MDWSGIDMSENIRHAKAPWTVEPPSEPDHEQDWAGKPYWSIRAAGEGAVISYELAIISGHNSEMDERNAKLISAAPELLAALQLALEYWQDRQQRYKNRAPAWVKEARAAIAKATNNDKE